MNIKKTLKILFTLFLVVPFMPIEAQNSREYIRNAIKGWGECRNVAITKTNGDVALYGRNGCARSGVPSGLDNALTELNSEQELIDDVQLTENGRWLILYGNNGFKWNDIPYSLERQIKEDNDKNEVITSVTFNDAGDWIVITTNHITASNSNVLEWIKDGMNQYGGVWAACVTDDAMVVVFERGYKFVGNVPSDLKGALKETKLDVYRLKIAGTSWFFADKDGSYRYNM